MSISSIFPTTFIPPILPQYPDIQTVNSAYTSSIEPANNSSLGPKVFNPPLLFLHLMDETYTIGAFFLETSAQEIKASNEHLTKRIQEMTEALQASSKRAQEAGVWSMLQKAGSCILSTFNLLLGGSLFTAGSPVLGTTLIASGVLSVANMAMTEVQGWNFVAERLAQNNKELKEQILFWPPLALNCLSGALSAVAGSAVVYDPTLVGFNILPYNLKDYAEPIKNYSELFSGVTTAGQSASSAQFTWTKAQVSNIQNSIASDTLLQEALMSWMQNFLDLLSHGWEQARTAIQMSNIRM